MKSLLKTHKNELEALAIVVLSGLIYLILLKVNPYYDIDRHYYQKNKIQYYALKLSYVVIILSLVLNTKFVILAMFRAALHSLATNLKR